jgi:hypothetical protein
MYLEFRVRCLNSSNARARFDARNWHPLCTSCQVLCSTMPLFNHENARQMGLKGVQARWERERARKAAFGSTNGAPVTLPSG